MRDSLISAMSRSRGSLRSTWLIAGVACTVLAPSRAANAQEASAKSASAQAVNSPRKVRIEVSLSDRTLWAISDRDTLLAAPVSVSSGEELRFGDQRWRFETPEGRHVIRTKRADPVWTPPDWHYAEAALAHGLNLEALPASGVTLRDGRRVAVHEGNVSVLLRDSVGWIPLPENEHIVFDSTLYIPPIGTRNREVRGELGPYALYLGDGYLLHGTRNQRGVGTATTHGCLRLRDEDITWLFLNVEVGTPVLIRH